MGMALEDGLTIAIPSNRPLATAGASLESAIGFATERGHRVVISDNSGDPAKAEWLSRVPAHVVVIDRAPADAAGNMWSAYAAVGTRFLMPMGDDDLVSAQGAGPDLKAVPEDVAAIKPDIVIRGGGGEVLRQAAFAISDRQPDARILAYASYFGGDNASYYSAWRTDIIRPIARLFTRHHPTRSGTGDWPIVMAGLAEGTMLVDPRTRFDYWLGAWQERGSIDAARGRLLASAGLPADAARLMPLFHHCDCHVYLSRQTSRLAPAGRLAAIRASAMVCLRPFARSVHQDPAAYPASGGLIAPLIQTLSQPQTDVGSLFNLALAILERLKPGLRQGYEAFLTAALNDAINKEDP